MFRKNAVILPEFIVILRRELVRQYGATLLGALPGGSRDLQSYTAREGDFSDPRLVTVPNEPPSHTPRKLPDAAPAGRLCGRLNTVLFFAL